MRENSQFVKWYVFWAIMLIVFSCIGSLFTNQSSIKTEYRDYVMEIKEDLATVKESVEWLKDFRPDIDRGDVSMNIVNSYKNLDKPSVENKQEFIKYLEKNIK